MFAILQPLMLTLLMQTTPVDPSLLTVAEKSDYTATSRSDEVLDLIDRIRQQSKIIRVSVLGKTVEGKNIPLVILANPPIETVQQAQGAVRAGGDGAGKPICFIMANIHAGEVEGKEACLLLIREIALNPEHPLLKNLIIIFAPNYNADGNDKFDDVARNRPGQVGPAHCGIRANSAGLDLNRDYMKLEAPESRCLVKFLDDWDPHLSIDCHTTNGSHHRYVLTYEAPLNPSGSPGPIDFVRNKLLPEVTKRIHARTDYDMWHYGNFNREHTIWETYSAQPRFGGPYQGLRNQMSILSEAYSYAPFKDRVIGTREFIREVLQYVAENKDDVIAINKQARLETKQKGENPQPTDIVGIRHRVAAMNKPAVVKGYEKAEGGEGGAAADPERDLGGPKDFSVIHLGRFEPTLSVRRPLAYIIPPSTGMDAILEKLRQHGIEFQPFQGEATVEAYTVTEIRRAKREFQGHHEVEVETSCEVVHRSLPAGSHIVRTAQPLGTLAVYLLEPQSEDGLLTWNFFDDQIKVGSKFPIVRVRAAADMAH